MSSSTSWWGKSSGIAKAAARVTTPRMPAQPSTKVYDGGGRCPDASGRGRTRRYRAGKTHASLRTMTAPRVAAHATAIVPAERLALGDVADDPAGLETDQEEDGVLEHERDRVPVEPLGDAGARGLQDRSLVAQQQPGHDHGQHARDVSLLGRDVGDEGRDQRQRRVHHRVGHVLAHPADGHEHHQPDDDTARRDAHEVEADLGHAEVAVSGEDRGAQRDQRRCVVEQRLTLEDRHEPSEATRSAGRSRSPRRRPGARRPPRWRRRPARSGRG